MMFTNLDSEVKDGSLSTIIDGLKENGIELHVM